MSIGSEDMLQMIEMSKVSWFGLEDHFFALVPFSFSYDNLG